jgi:hypothetical protein
MDDPRIPMDDRDLARFMRKVEVHPSGCWIWMASTNGKYGVFHFYAHKVYAHRVSYEHHVGEIPTGLTIDHLCKVKLCVNPAHLEAVTYHENLSRSDAWIGVSNYHRPDQTKCGAGLHDWIPANWKKHGNGVKCRLCHNQRNQEYKERKRDA